jgi:hypothetical protein
MRKPFIVCCTVAVVLAASAIASPRAEVMTVASPAAEAALAQDVTYGGYSRPPYRVCGYYHYVCRAWWKGCGWEGPYFISIPYWGMRYLCF